MGESPSVFIGSKNYPSVSGGPLMVGEPDNPEDWVRRNYSIDDIVGVRAGTIKGTSRLTAKNPLPDSRIEEIALSKIPLDVEASFEKPVSFDLRFDGILAPVGLSGSIEKLKVLDNASVPVVVDKITSDTDLKANNAVIELYNSGIDHHYITQLLTSGQLGVKRHIVPTRWGITAVDDTISNALKREIMKNPPVSGITMLNASLHSNRIICVLFPGEFRFEMIEIWNKGSMWGGSEEDSIIVDFEGEKRKTNYSPITGAYYSARLAVLEYLRSIRRCASVLVIRQVSKDYWAPLGTWVIREASRKAMNSTPRNFEDVIAVEREITMLLGSQKWRGYSRLLNDLKSQKRLFDFF
jgi:DNA repair protein NreA